MTNEETEIPYEFIEAVDFAELERQGKIEKNILYVVHGGIDDIEYARAGVKNDKKRSN